MAPKMISVAMMVGSIAFSAAVCFQLSQPPAPLEAGAPASSHPADRAAVVNRSVRC